MIIGNSLVGMLGGGSKSSGYSTQGTGDTRGSGEPASAAQDAGNKATETGGGNAVPFIQSDHRSSSSFGADREEAVSMHQTARIMALVASMRQVDDVSAYSLFARGDGETDEHRHVVSAYSENSE
ncbi:MAG: hypothetical protein WDZ83_13630 [Rhizobiaceae bacterium]